LEELRKHENAGNQLFYGDNLHVLPEHLAAESVDFL